MRCRSISELHELFCVNESSRSNSLQHELCPLLQWVSEIHRSGSHPHQILPHSSTIDKSNFNLNGRKLLLSYLGKQRHAQGHDRESPVIAPYTEEQKDRFGPHSHSKYSPTVQSLAPMKNRGSAIHRSQPCEGSSYDGRVAYVSDQVGAYTECADIQKFCGNPTTA